MDDGRWRILEVLERACGESLSAEDLKESPLADWGSPVAFRLAKKLKRSPQDIAEEIAAKIRSEGVIRSVSAEGGYVNFTLDMGEIARKLLSGERVGRKKPGKIILEHTSVNPTGPVHVGRIRNTIIGDCLRRILQYSGYDVETHYYVNDIGKQVAIIAAGFADGIEEDPELRAKYIKYAGREDYEVFFTYVRANKLFEENPGFQTRVQSLIKAAESGDDEALAQITSAAKRCLGGQLKTFERLNVRFDVFDWESEGLRDGGVEEVLRQVRASKVYAKNETGEGLELSRWGLEKRGGISVLARADGTSVYLTRDLAYHMKKVRLGDRIINVLGEDHKLQFQELKTILSEVLGVKAQLEVVHFSFVSFEGMKFSTRKGEIAAADELLDEAVAKAQLEAQKRGIGDESTARMIGVGAVKFHIVKTTPNKQILFKWEDALSFDGEAAPYVQYAHARSCRILEKGAGTGKAENADYGIDEPEEKKLILKLAQFDDAVEAAANALRPDLVATYLLELTAAYGRFYMKCPVLDAPEGVRDRRLLLVARNRDTIRCGLDLLGIEAPERM
jgi:arginyl-tRNA synthetase